MMSVIESFLSRLSESLAINSSLCSRVRHKDSDCSDCLDACASGAINITRPGGKVVVNWERCTSCGECIPVCSNSVFEMKLVEKTKLLSIVSQSIKNSREAVFACHNKQTDTTAGITTLAFADHKLMIKTVIMGAERILLLTDDCTKCRHENCLNTIYREISTAKDIFNKAGLSIEIKTAPYHSNGKTFSKRLPENDTKVMNRREFFNFVKKRTKKNIGEVIYSVSENDNEKAKTRLAINSEKLKSLFIDDIKNLGGEKLLFNLISSGYLPNVKINEETCKRCGICSKICPFNVLQPEYETVKGIRHIKTVNIVIGSCTGCSLCLNVCMSKSIVLETRP
jgi:ferredoxin